MRTSKRDVQVAFERFCETFGFTVGWGVGEYRLDNGSYGGYVVETVVNEKGGVSRPFGSTRHSAREMCAMLWFAADAAYHARQNTITDDEPAS